MNRLCLSCLITGRVSSLFNKASQVAGNRTIIVTDVTGISHVCINIVKHIKNDNCNTLHDQLTGLKSH